MSQQIIDIGAEANDGTGEPLRSAFDAVNNNFTQIFSAGPVGSDVKITGNTITVTGTNNNLVLAANGIGNIQSNSSIIPGFGGVYSLGSSDSQFDSVYAVAFYGNGAGLTGVSVDAGNVILNGNSNVRIGAANANVTVSVSNVSNVAVFSTSGLTVASNINVGNLNAVNLAVSGSITTNLVSQANITANYFLGNGSQLSGMYSNTSVQDFLPTYTGNLVALQGNITTTANISGGNIRSTGTVSATGAVVAGNVTSLGRVTAVGNVSSNEFFVGNGRFLTGVVSAPAPLYKTVNANGTPLIAGNTDATLTLTPGNNIVITGNDLTLDAKFDVSQSPVFQGIVSAVGNIISNSDIIATANVSGGNILTAGLVSATGNIAGSNINAVSNIAGGNVSATANITGNNISATSNISAGNVSASGTVSAAGFVGNSLSKNGASVEFDDNGNVIVTPTGSSPNTNWSFVESGNINLGQSYGKIINSGSFGVGLWATDFAYTTLEWSANGVEKTSVVRVDANVSISTAAGEEIWKFDPTGNLILPNGMKLESVSGDDPTVAITGGNTRIQIDQEGQIGFTSSDGTGNTYTWEFANDGTTYLPHNNVGNVTYIQNSNESGNIDLEIAADKDVVLRANTYSGSGPAWTFGTNGSLEFPNNANIIDGAFNAGSASATVSLNAFSPDGNTVSIQVQGNTSAAVIQTYADSTNTTNTWTFDVTGDLTAPGNISGNYILGNGSQLTGLPATYGNANVATYLSSGTNSANIITTANVSGNYILGNGSQLTGMYSNSQVANYLPTYTGNLVSMLGNIITTGDITGGNIKTPGFVSAAGNITGSYILGNGSLLTGVISSYTNADVAAYLPTYTGNLVSLQGNVTTTANIAAGNIGTTGKVSAESVTATGNVSAGNVVVSDTVSAKDLTTTGNAIIGGNLFVNGDTTYINITDLNVEDPIIGLGRGANNSPLTTNDGKDRGEQLWYYADSEKSAFVGYDNSEGKMIVAANVSIINEIVTVNAYGNTALGNLEAQTVVASANITGGNIATAGTVSATGTVTGGNIATAGTVSATGTVTGGNIATAGTVSATGTLTAGNLTTAGTVSATGNIVGGNVNTTNLSLAGNVVGALNVTGNITGGNIKSVGSLTAAFISSSGNIVTGAGAGGNITGANVISAITFSASGNVQAANVNSGFISATGNINSAKINTDEVYADVVSVTGNVVSGNVNTGIVSASGNITGSNVSTALLAATTANITGNVNSGNINVVSNIAGGNISTAGTLSAGGNITGSNISTAGTLSAGGNITGANLTATGQVSANTMFATSAISTFGNVNAGNGITTQTFIEAIGNITGGNIISGAQISAVGAIISNGNITGANLISTSQISSAGNITAVGNVIGTNFIGNVVGNITTPGANTQLIFNRNGVLGANSGLVFDYVGNVLTVGGDIATQNGGNIQVAGALSVTGNITVGVGNINGGNILGTVIVASGNITGGNITTSGTVTATGNITGGNLSGTSIAGTLITSSQTNITAVGTLDSLAVTGNISGGNLLTGGLIAAVGNIAGIGNVSGGNLLTGGLVQAQGNVTGGNLTTAGQVVAAGNVTGGNVLASTLTATRVVIAGINGVLSDTDGFAYTAGNSTLSVANIATGTVSATGNVTVGNVITGGLISAAGNVTGGNLNAAGLSLSGNVISALNMTTNITTTGNITANNITATTAINIAGNQVATVDDATALAIALG
jgi:hypothetical protein